MDNRFNPIKNLIDGEGRFIGTIHEKEEAINAIEDLARNLLGSTLSVRGNKFIIRMLEIYYGGIGDDAQDFYRNHYVYKNSRYKVHSETQCKEGFRVYLSSLDLNDTYTRFDIVVGASNVPASLLIRSVWDSDFHLIGTGQGSPNIILKAMGLRAEDHDSIIHWNSREHEIYLEDTGEKIRLEIQVSQVALCRLFHSA